MTTGGGWTWRVGEGNPKHPRKLRLHGHKKISLYVKVTKKTLFSVACSPVELESM